MERDEFFNEVKRLRGQGRSIRAIARGLGTNKSRVERAVKALISTPDEKPTLISPPGWRAKGIFVGRQREMHALQAALEDTLSGQGRLVMLAGEPGIGKTRTARELASLAATRGAQALWGWCYEEMGAPPYWPWVHAIRSYIYMRDPEQLRAEMGPGAADIAELIPEVREKLPGLEPPLALEPEQARFRLFESITTFLKNVAQIQPLVIVLDDLHWADRSSLLLLEFVARELAESRLLLVGTYRDVEVTRHHPLSQTLGNLVRPQSYRRVRLGGLTPKEVQDFVEVTVGVSPTQGFVEAIHRRTEGNPLFVTELVRLLQQGGVEEEQSLNTVIPEGIRGAIRRRLDRLSEGCNQILTIASVMGREFDFKLLTSLRDNFSEVLLLQLVEEALEALVILELPECTERYRFSHPLIQETLLGELSSSRRVRIHARIAQALEELYQVQVEEHASELAYHFTQASPVLGTAWLVKYSLVAGERDLKVYAYEEALDHFERALAAKRGLPMDRETADILFGLGCSQVATYQGQVGLENIRHAFDYYDEMGDIDKIVTLVEYRTSLPIWEQDVSYLVSRALQLIPSDSYQAAVVMSTQGAYLLAAVTGGSDAIMDMVGDALAIARREQDLRLEMRILSNAAVMIYATGSWERSIKIGLSAISLARRAQAPTLEAIARGSVTRSLACMGDFRGAKSQSVEMLVAVEEMPDRSWKPIGFATMTLLGRLAGDWGAAKEYSDRGLALAPTAWDGLLLRVLLEYELGNIAEGQAYLDQMAKLMLLDTSRPIHERIFAALGVVMSDYMIRSNDRLDVANSVAQSILSSAPEMPIIYATSTRISLALCSVIGGNRAKATEQYLALQIIAGQYIIYIGGDRLLGLLAHAMGNLNKATEHFEDAIAFCRKAGYRPELAWTCYEYANVLQEIGQNEMALAILNEALAISTDLGMKPLIERIVSLRELALSRPAKTPVYPDALTEREVEVLRLIAQGFSNRQIATTLVITEGTVRRHVSNLYLKINVTNRSQATRYALSSGLLSSEDAASSSANDDANPDQ